MTQGCHRTQGDLRPSPRNDTEVRMNEKQSNPAAFNRYLNLWNYIKMRRPYKVAEERREAKGKVEKERYIHLNAAFQRIGRRDKKAFLSDQCKERKTIEWERLEISSRILELRQEHFMQRWAQ